MKSDTFTFEELLEKFSNSGAIYNPTEQEDDSVWYAYWHYTDTIKERKYGYGIVKDSIDNLNLNQYDNADYEKYFSEKQAKKQLIEWKSEHKQDEQ